LYRKSILLSCAFTASIGFSLSEGKIATFRRVSIVLNEEDEEEDMAIRSLSRSARWKVRKSDDQTYKYKLT
jgi:hypothetical protein